MIHVYDTKDDSINDSENQTTGHTQVLQITSSNVTSRKYTDNVRFHFVWMLVTGLYLMQYLNELIKNSC